MLDTKGGGNKNKRQNEENKRVDDQETTISPFQNGMFDYFNAGNSKTEYDKNSNTKLQSSELLKTTRKLDEEHNDSKDNTGSAIGSDILQKSQNAIIKDSVDLTELDKLEDDKLLEILESLSQLNQETEDTATKKMILNEYMVVFKILTKRKQTKHIQKKRKEKGNKRPSTFLTLSQDQRKNRLKTSNSSMQNLCKPIGSHGSKLSELLCVKKNKRFGKIKVTIIF